MKINLNEILSQLADEIDITDSQEGAIKSAYNSVADWLNQNNTKIAKHAIHIFPQGSMMYGTAIKPVNEEDDYDIDLVCEFVKLTNNLQPSYVKQSVGERLSQNATYKKMMDSEGRRCWTLQYSDSLNFHMDILPSIPFSEEYRQNENLRVAYESITNNRELALLATDKDKITCEYKYTPTNPRGYAEWFKERMQLNKKHLIFESVERVPDYPRKTVLQKAIQLLKRHRDVSFLTEDNDLKPISMIITTLMAKCYNGENEIFDFIRIALDKIPSFIEKNRDGNYVITNPVMKIENFADKWTERPPKAQAFWSWVRKAKADFSILSNIVTYSDLDCQLKKMFSQKPVDRLMLKYSSAIQHEKEVAATLCDELSKPASLVTLEHIPYRISPPWTLPRGYRVKILGQVSYDGKSFEKFASNTVLPKHVDLRFFPMHSFNSPYRVKWQITNTGMEARNADSLRGNKFEDSELQNAGVLSGKKESTAYTGTHYIQCFIIKNGNQCIGVSEPFIVRVE